METITIKWLSPDEFRILKRIVIIGDRNSSEVELGSIFYTRELTDDYAFKKPMQEDESDQISRIMSGYPKQENYPNDELDEIIIEAIRKSFPKSIVQNDTILFTVDLDKLQVMKRRNIAPAVMYFSPDFSHFYDLARYVGKEFKAPALPVNIYTYYNTETLSGQVFYADCAAYEAESLEPIPKLKTLKFE